VSDGRGRLLPVDWPGAWLKQLPPILPEAPGRFALVGLARLGGRGLTLRCLSVVGDLNWAAGPLYPTAG
jgi:hypothetical protein